MQEKMAANNYVLLRFVEKPAHLHYALTSGGGQGNCFLSDHSRFPVIYGKDIGVRVCKCAAGVENCVHKYYLPTYSVV